MSFDGTLGSWLMFAAILNALTLAVGAAALWFCRQPPRRLRIMELTLAACLVAPALGLIPGYPQWAVLPRHAPTPESSAADQKADDAVTAAHFMPVSDPQPKPAASLAGSDVGPLASSAGVGRVGPWLLGIYGLGVAVCLAWWAVGWAALARVVWTAEAVAPRCRRLFRQIAGRRGEGVRLLQSRLARQPFAAAWGLTRVAEDAEDGASRTHWRFLRPIIVLPEEFCRDEPALRLALAHEWTHIERGDFRVWLMAELARSLFFFQPLVWWLRSQLRLCQDYVADARASCEADAPEDYAEFLTTRAAAGLLRPSMAGLGMGSRPSELLRRVVMLVQNRPFENRPPRWWTVAVTCVGVTLIALAGTLTVAPRADAQVAGRTENAVQATTGGASVKSAGPQQATAPARAEKSKKKSRKRGEWLVGVRPTGNCSIAGQVVSAETGKPIAGARVYLHYKVTHGSIFVNTDEDGRFLLKELPVGPFSLQASHTPGWQDINYNPDNKPQGYPPFSLKAGEHRTGIVLKAKPACWITGKVVDENGAVPKEADHLSVVVWFKSDDGKEYECEHFGVNPKTGAFKVDYLNGSPTYLLVIDWDGAKQGTALPPIYYPSVFSRSDAKLITFDKSRHVDNLVITRRQRGGVAVEGVVRDEAGKPIPKAFVVIHHDDMAFDFSTGYTDSKGHYRIDCLGDGEFTIQVDAAHCGFVRTREPLKIDQKTGSITRDFTLRRGVKISGKFVDEHGNAWRIGSSDGGVFHPKASRRDDKGGFSLTRFWNKYNPKDVSYGSGGEFARGQGDYTFGQMFFPTTDTFVALGIAPGTIKITFSPNKEHEKVAKILYQGKDILESGVDIKVGDELKDVTIVIGPEQSK